VDCCGRCGVNIVRFREVDSLFTVERQDCRVDHANAPSQPVARHRRRGSEARHHDHSDAGRMTLQCRDQRVLRADVETVQRIRDD
jgi:hypothetical protein